MVGGGMGKKLLAIIFAGAIVASGIWVVQAQFRINKPVTVRPNIQSYIWQNIYGGAEALRTAKTKLAELPGQVGTMFDELSNQRPKIQTGIKTLQDVTSSLGGLKSEIENNAMIVPKIKTPLLSSIATLQTTLPNLLKVFERLDAEIVKTVNKKNEKMGDLKAKVDQATASIDQHKGLISKLGIGTGDLPTRLDELGNLLKNFGIG